MAYKIDTNIPGWSSEDKLSMLAEYASKVVAGGLIVEVGSFCGRSAYAMGMNKKDDTKLVCVDMFYDSWLNDRTVSDYPGTESCYGDKSEKYSFETFCKNTKDVKNLDTIRMVLPYNDRYMNFTGEIDLLFIDATHTYEAVKADIEQWCPHLKEDAVVIFDDYFDMFPGCMKAVDEYVAAIGKSINVIDHAAVVTK